MVLQCVVMGFLLIGGLGLFSFEGYRANLAYDELRSACESAALAGAATLAGSDQTDPTIAHQNAIAA